MNVIKVGYFQMLGNHPKERIQHSKHGKSFKSRTVPYLSKKRYQIYILSKETLCDIGKG
jgi:hypothetical protein